MKIIWHGTASVEIRNEQGKILFDPFVPIAHSTVPVTLEEFDGFSEIFITHGHLDHIADIPRIVRRNPNTVVHCTKTPYQTLLRFGVQKNNLQLLNYEQKIEVNGFVIRTLHGKHAVLPKLTKELFVRLMESPARENLLPLLRMNRKCREADETLFYSVETEGKVIHLMGSLNVREETAYPTGADLLILPYNGWTDNFPPACRVIERLQPKRVVLDHYDNTFPPLTEELDLSPILNIQTVPVKPLILHAEEIV